MAPILLLLAAFTASACASAEFRETQAVTCAECDPTSGFVRMDEQRRIYVTYDDTPGMAVLAVPGEPAYAYYLELAGGLGPGERKRLRIPGPHFDVRLDGSFVIYGWAQGQGTYGEPSPTLVEPSDVNYSCYHEQLGAASVGSHVMTLGDYRRVEACLAGAPAPTQ